MPYYRYKDDFTNPDAFLRINSRLGLAINNSYIINGIILDATKLESRKGITKIDVITDNRSSSKIFAKLYLSGQYSTDLELRREMDDNPITADNVTPMGHNGLGNKLTIYPNQLYNKNSSSVRFNIGICYYNPQHSSPVTTPPSLLKVVLTYENGDTKEIDINNLWNERIVLGYQLIRTVAGNVSVYINSFNPNLKATVRIYKDNNLLMERTDYPFFKVESDKKNMSFAFFYDHRKVGIISVENINNYIIYGSIATTDEDGSNPKGELLGVEVTNNTEMSIFYDSLNAYDTYTVNSIRAPYIQNLDSSVGEFKERVTRTGIGYFSPSHKKIRYLSDVGISYKPQVFSSATDIHLCKYKDSVYLKLPFRILPVALKESV